MFWPLVVSAGVLVSGSSSRLRFSQGLRMSSSCQGLSRAWMFSAGMAPTIITPSWL